MSSSASVEAFRQAADRRSRPTSTSRRTWCAALLFVLITIPLARFTDWLVAPRRALARSSARRRAVTPTRPPLRIEGVHKRFGEPRCCAASTSTVARARGGLPDRRLGLGQVDAAALHQPARAGRRRAGSSSTARTSPRPAWTPNRIRRRHRHRVPGVQPVPAHDACSTTSRSRRARCSGSRGAEAEAQAMELLERFGLADKARRVPRPALRRPAAAGRDRAGAGDAAASCCCSTRSPARSTRSWSARCST